MELRNHRTVQRPNGELALENTRSRRINIQFNDNSTEKKSRFQFRFKLKEYFVQETHLIIDRI